MIYGCICMWKRKRERERENRIYALRCVAWCCVWCMRKKMYAWDLFMKRVGMKVLFWKACLCMKNIGTLAFIINGKEGRNFNPETTPRPAKKKKEHQENVQLVFGVFVFGICIFDIFSQRFCLWYVFRLSLSLEIYLSSCPSLCKFIFVFVNCIFVSLKRIENLWQ